MSFFGIESIAKLLNDSLSVGPESYYLQLLKPGQIEPGFFIYWQDKFQEVVAAKWEQGSCMTPNRTSIAFKDNPHISDIPSNLTIIQLKKLD